ncbi:MAG: flagellar basal body-associated FliL family protein [Alphaproteobacteria bacterium]|nr:flagellar basal body-associated FliL family protein [Alphaproteobacteria bacterium]
MAAKKETPKPKDDQDVSASLDAPATEGDPLGEEGKSKFDAKKIILFVVLPILLLGGGGAGLYFSGMLDSVLGKGEAADASGEAGAHGEKAKGDGHGGEAGVASGPAFIKIPDMVVNLSGNDAQPRYLRLSVQLELKDPGDTASIEAVMPRVVDQFQTYLRELRVKDLRGSAGIYRLQMELLARVNAAAYPVEVKDVLFQEILIQ